GGMPGGSSGGGMPGGSSGGGMPGGSSGGSMPGGSSGGGMSGGSSGGGMPGGSSGGMSGGGGDGVRGLGGSLPGGAGGGDAAGSGQAGNCGNDLPGGVGGMEQPGDCDGSAAGGAGGVGQYPGETDAERKARLEGELEKSVGGFDEVLAEEQEEISTVSRDTGGFGGSGSGGGGPVGLGKQAGVRGSGEVAQAPPERRPPSLEGMSDEEIEARTPDDIPTLVSEDIVAKQLREAALAEDDPELRERLWDEYRRYNQL
ncbi:MAG TPA: hypothetical protein VFE85_06730, partial [Woeseiaceae bacterium]|nr:hypothetical protein [Woeseiaceae bacterium]